MIHDQSLVVKNDRHRDGIRSNGSREDPFVEYITAAERGSSHRRTHILDVLSTGAWKMSSFAQPQNNLIAKYKKTE